jgi:16S rRNA (guanine966-N2)-methyltransferase
MRKCRVAELQRRGSPIVFGMRVVAGELGGRKIVAPEGTNTRPTTDRVREAIFNSLGSSGILDGALVADLFAGSGAVGIEALSRGAERCVFVERDRNARYALEDNLEALNLGDRSKVITSDAMAVASSLDCDIVFADPPYDFDAWERLLGLVRADLLVAESGRSITCPPGWEITREKKYGRTVVTFLERSDLDPPQ